MKIKWEIWIVKLLSDQPLIIHLMHVYYCTLTITQQNILSILIFDAGFSHTEALAVIMWPTVYIRGMKC